jgi:hypothetical protein
VISAFVNVSPFVTLRPDHEEANKDFIAEDTWPMLDRPNARAAVSISPTRTSCLIMRAIVRNDCYRTTAIRSEAARPRYGATVDGNRQEREVVHDVGGRHYPEQTTTMEPSDSFAPHSSGIHCHRHC